MKATHTPGPWTLQDDATFSTLGDKRIVGANMISPAIVFGGIAETKANARLIAKAPDLLEHLAYCCEQLAECMEQNNGRIWDNANTVMANARALLAEVEA